MYVYKNLLAAFTLESAKDAPTRAADTAIKAKLGDKAKQGWSQETQDVARGEYTAAGAEFFTVLTGEMKNVQLSQTSDGKTVHQKLWITLGHNGTDIIISLDRDTELAQRLLCKLVNVVPGTVVTLETFAEKVARGGRTFVNHAPKLKTDGKEIPAEPGHFAAAAEKARTAVETLRPSLVAAGLGGNPDEMKKMLERTRIGAKNTYFAALAERVEAKFAGANDGTDTQPEGEKENAHA